MQHLPIFILLTLLSTFLRGQTNISVGNYGGDFKVEIVETSGGSADLTFVVTEEVKYQSTFTIGFTISRSDADIVIKDGNYGDFRINAHNYISGEDVSIYIEEYNGGCDVRVGLRNYGPVDYLIYVDAKYIDKKILSAALVSVLPNHIPNDYYVKNFRHKLPNVKQGNKSPSKRWEVYLSNPKQTYLVGKLEGVARGNIFTLADGSTWMQVSDLHEHANYLSPKVLIYNIDGVVFLKIEEIKDIIEVERIGN